MKRTTLALDTHVLRRLKERAAREGVSMQSLANSLLRQALERPPRETYTLHMIGWKAVVSPGVDILDRNSLLDAMDDRSDPR